MASDVFRQPEKQAFVFGVYPVDGPMLEVVFFLAILVGAGMNTNLET